GADGPFEVELACLRDVDGESVPVDIPGGAVRELSEETDYQTTYSELPLGAECVVTETEDGGAASTQITLESADGEESTEGTSIDVTVDDPEDEKVVRVINTFDPDPVDDPDTGDSDKPGASSWLPRTGAEILTAIGVGVLLVLTGLGLYRIRRSRA
ncbi:MAG TPA: DUF5979 domain-containing protein, partial [Actinomycetales bacterium]|nr:DUF5979 domain-containing protein [Actinomycetales bacterium]